MILFRLISASRCAAPCGPRAVRRGMTMIEVVIATAMLGTLAAMILGAISFMETSAARQRHRLNAAEVAHRVIAQHLDQPDIMPDSSKPLQFADSYYRFAIREEVLMNDDNSTSDLTRRRARNRSELTVEEQLPALLNRVTVTVYLDDPSSPVVDASRPLAELSRMYNPITGRDEDIVLEHLMKMIDQMNREQAKRAREEAQRARDSGRN